MKQFEAGDWLRAPKHNHIFQFTSTFIEDDTEYVLDGYDDIFGQQGWPISEVEPWEPQPGEWCWNPIFGLVKVLCETKTKGYFICWNPWQKEEQTLRISEPFIGELPQFNAINDEKTITRVEIINEKGRAFVDTKSTYKLSFQDSNQTLKLFKQGTI